MTTYILNSSKGKYQLLLLHSSTLVSLNKIPLVYLVSIDSPSCMFVVYLNLFWLFLLSFMLLNYLYSWLLDLNLWNFWEATFGGVFFQELLVFASTGCHGIIFSLFQALSSGWESLVSTYNTAAAHTMVLLPGWPVC